MKIGILTQPLHSNYGGLLQAWALQQTLVEMGHKAIIINRIIGKSDRSFSWRRLAYNIKNELLILFGKRKKHITVTDDLRIFSEQNVNLFKNKRYLGISPVLSSNEELYQYVELEDFDAYVVGSDQVWRPRYSPNLITYFLDFVKDKNNVKKIAYAASFGVDTWELSNSETNQAKKLLPLFDVITVRETSGIDLVEKYLNCHATLVLDPTMLRNRTDYIDLINNSTTKLYKSKGELFCYILNTSSEVSEIINNCKNDTGLESYICNSEIPYDQLTIDDDKQKCVVPSVEQWLKSFYDAKMVITDSFHGTVFSIIFKKPFWVIINKGRGATRFYSILNQLDLHNRIIHTSEHINWDAAIDWSKVSKKLDELSIKSRNILNILNT